MQLHKPPMGRKVREECDAMKQASEQVALPISRHIESVEKKESESRYQNDVRTLAGKLLTVQDEERRRISRDLHDDVNQRLGAIGLQLDTLSRNLPGSPSVIRRRIRTIRHHVSELSDEVRELAYRFHQTTVEDFGLVVALQRYLNDFVKRTGISARFTKPRSAESIPLRLATCLYRIAQESLGNVGLHAKATQVSLALDVASEAVSLTVCDDGIGMDLEEVGRRREGLGMLSMEERAKLLNGTVSWLSSPGKGTTVIARFDLGTESP